MKKKVFIFVAIISITVLLLAFTGCNDAFNSNDMREQVENNLGWHKMTNTEVSEYDVFDKDGKLIGKYTSSVSLVNKQDIVIETVDSANNYTLKGFSGYKYVTSLSIIDNESYSMTTESYSSLNMAPKFSYKKVVDGTTTEILTSYAEKNANVTFVIDGNKVSSSAKYKEGSLISDSSYLYQFARATDMTSALSIIVPSYTMTEDLTQVYNQTISMIYASNSNIVLNNTFILDKEFSETQTPSGDIASEDINSGDISNINSGAFDNSGDIQSTEDASGNIVTTYPYTETATIPVKKCTFTATKELNIKASVSCYVATVPMRNIDGDKFVNRVAVMIQEGDITYKLTSVKYV